MKKFTSFSNVTMPNPVDANGNFQNNFSYDPGEQGEIVVVRLFYQYPVYVSLLGFGLSNVNGGKRLLAATAAFRNEPFPMRPRNEKSPLQLPQYLVRLGRDQRGVSAVEFAMLLPLMITLYLGVVEISQAVGIDRKVTLTTRTVADLASQVKSIPPPT